VKGDYYFDYHNYGMAIANYRKSANQNPKDAYAMLRIADAYHRLGNDDLAVSWYDKALRLNADIEETYILKYMSLLNKYEKYDELRRWKTVYTDKVNKKYPSGDVNESHKDSTWFLLSNLKSINSAKSDAGAALFNDKLIFSSDRSVNNDGKYTLYRAVVNANGQYSALTPLPETINSGTNEGDVAIAHRQSRLFFSRTGLPKGDKKALPEVFFCDLPADLSAPDESKKLVIKNFDHGMAHPAVKQRGHGSVFHL
jgi:tetratricopeptide (TPR) repeat protein